MKNKQQLKLVKKLTGINLLIDDLRRTRENFTVGNLHRHDDATNRCSYCAEGVLLKKSGIPKDEFLNEMTIADFDMEGEAEKKFKARYGVDPTETYLDYIKCPLCTAHTSLTCLENLIFHVNDEHGFKLDENNDIDDRYDQSFKFVAENLEKINKIYNIRTGVARRR